VGLYLFDAQKYHANAQKQNSSELTFICMQLPLRADWLRHRSTPFSIKYVNFLAKAPHIKPNDTERYPIMPNSNYDIRMSDRYFSGIAVGKRSLVT
jgi:hypothetical protein